MVTKSLFVHFNASKTGALGGIVGRGSAPINASLGFIKGTLFFTDTTEEKDDSVDEEKSPGSRPSMLLLCIGDFSTLDASCFFDVEAANCFSFKPAFDPPSLRGRFRDTF